MHPSRTLLALAALFVVPASSACSIAYSEFGQAAWDGDRVFADRGQGIVTIQLTMGLETSWHETWFPRFGAAGGRVVTAGQDGLGADCAGTTWLRVQNATTGVVQHEAERAPFAVWDGGYVWYDEGLRWRTWHGATGSIADSDLGIPDEYEILVAASADGSRVAVGRGDGSALRVFERATQARLHVELGAVAGGVPDGAHGLALDATGVRLARGVVTDGRLVVHAVDLSTAKGWTFGLSGTGFAWPATDLAWTAGPLVVRFRARLAVLDMTDGDILEVDGPNGRVPGGLAAQDGRVAVLWRDADLQEGAAILIVDEHGRPAHGYTRPAGLWIPGDSAVATREGGRAERFAASQDGGAGGDGSEPPGRDVPSPGLAYAAAALAMLVAAARRRNT